MATLFVNIIIKFGYHRCRPLYANGFELFNLLFCQYLYTMSNITVSQDTTNNIYYNDGVLGNIVFVVNTTLTADSHYNNLTVNPGVTIYTNGYRLFVRNVLTLGVGSIIQNNGGDATLGVAGTAAISTSFGTSGSGATGVATNNSGTASTDLVNSLGGVGGFGGGTSSSSTTGGRSGSAVLPIYDVSKLTYGIFESPSYSYFGGGSGGGSGDCLSGTISGGGGGGGGVCCIVAKYIVEPNCRYAYIRALGGAGGAATGEGYGGGGGGGGVVILITKTSLNQLRNVILDTSGGIPGNGSSSAYNGFPGYSGRIIYGNT